MKRFAILLLISALALPVAAQDYQVPEIEISKDKVLVDGKPFFAHVVTAKQTLFSISKAYGVSVSDIREANKKLDLENKGLKTGDVLLIPDVISTPPEPESTAGELMDEPDMAAVPKHMKADDDEAYMQPAGPADTLIDHRALFPGSRDYYPETDPQHYADSVFYMNQIPERISVSVLLPFNASGTADSNSRDFYAGVLLAARDLETLPKGSRFIIVDGWNMVLGDGSDPRRAKSSRDLVAKWQAYLASRTGDFVWIVFDGHDDNTRQDGRLRVSYTGGSGAQRADRFICDFLRMARFQGLSHRVEVVTSDKKLLKEAERLIKK